MEFGLYSSGERTNRIAADTYDEDLFEIMAADKLGFREARIAEHIGLQGGETRPDKLSVADLFITKAAALTKQIRLGPGIRPLAIYHPVQVATDAAVCDHLTRGRYMAGFGVGAGSVGRYMQQRGLEEPGSSARARMHEAIDLILRCWTEPEPFDYDGMFWQGKAIDVIPKPYQKPHMPVGIAVSKTMGTAEMAGRLGFAPLFSQNDHPDHLREMGDVFVEAAKAAGRKPRRSDIRVCRVVWVSDSVKRARDELTPSITPYIEGTKRAYPGHYRHYLPPSGQVEDITFDHLADSGHMFVGDPELVYGRIKELYERSGGFGTFLVVLGKDYGTPRQRVRSLRLFMEHVVPRLRELDPDRTGPLEAAFA